MGEARRLDNPPQPGHLMTLAAHKAAAPIASAVEAEEAQPGSVGPTPCGTPVHRGGLHLAAFAVDIGGKRWDCPGFG